MNDTLTIHDGTAFTQNGRKGVSYDWQSLCDAETLVVLQELDNLLNDQLNDAPEFAIAAAE